MSLSRERVMPIIRATWHPLRRAWIVALPGGVELAVPLADDVPALIARHAPGSAIDFVRPGQRTGAGA